MRGINMTKPTTPTKRGYRDIKASLMLSDTSLETRDLKLCNRKRMTQTLFTMGLMAPRNELIANRETTVPVNFVTADTTF